MQVINGTSYHDDTPQGVITALENARMNRWRVRVWLGDRETGRVWSEENDVLGYIGRSTGSIKIPLLVYNTRSCGAPALLDERVMRIVRTSDKRELYRHPTYNHGAYRVTDAHDYLPPEYTASVDHTFGSDWENVANFETVKQAIRWVKFMTGSRMSK